MKSISAAIIVSAGLFTLAWGATVRHGDTSLFVSGSAAFVVAVGLLGWLRTLSLSER